jgi:hypothetical protein
MARVCGVARVGGLIAILAPVLLCVAACSGRSELPDEALLQAHTAQLAATRVAERVPAEALANFSLVLYVDKSSTGPLAQHMIVFERQAGEAFAPLYVWPVSTGREDLEPDAKGRQESTTTPEGLFALDRKRMYASYVSAQWDEAMPYAMFLSGGAQTGGLAIHAATGEGIAHIGTRASAGCVRLPPENARSLFDLVRRRFSGSVPLLARGTNSNQAEAALQHDAKGRLRHANGYSVLVVIDDYPAVAPTNVAAR